MTNLNSYSGGPIDTGHCTLIVGIVSHLGPFKTILKVPCLRTIFRSC